MAYKQFQLDQNLPVTIYKRKSSRSIKLSISPKGEVRVSLPTWLPYSAGLTFARSRRAWIAQQHTAPPILSPGQRIGKAHRLQFQPNVAGTKVTSKVRQTEVIITHPQTLAYDNLSVQQAAETAAVRALRRQAQALLPQRLAQLADTHGFSYSGVAVKQLKSRWGSCDHQGFIVLNLFLVQLPWDCIDYVLLHELTHTRVLQHGPAFWEAMETLLADVKGLRKAIRQYQPVLQDMAT